MIKKCIKFLIIAIIIIIIAIPLAITVFLVWIMALIGSLVTWAFSDDDQSLKKTYASICSDIGCPLPYKKAWLK